MIVVCIAWLIHSVFFLISDVPIWLKTLRLHKYAYLFQQLTYEDMLGITEQWLEARVRSPYSAY